MEIRETQEWVGVWANQKGWNFTKGQTPEKLMMVVSDVSKAMDDYREDNFGMNLNEYRRDATNKPVGFGIELAKAVIRIMHICHRFDIDLQAMLEVEMAYLEKREYRHGGKLA